MVSSPAYGAALAPLAGALTGEPLDASGSWLRLAYLSVVTATTLGFGDITPVSSDARFAVGLEAVLGVVLIGFFLNAVARKALRQSPASRDS